MCFMVPKLAFYYNDEVTLKDMKPNKSSMVIMGICRPCLCTIQHTNQLLACMFLYCVLLLACVFPVLCLISMCVFLYCVFPVLLLVCVFPVLCY